RPLRIQSSSLSVNKPTRKSRGEGARTSPPATLVILEQRASMLRRASPGSITPKCLLSFGRNESARVIASRHFGLTEQLDGRADLCQRTCQIEKIAALRGKTFELKLTQVSKHVIDPRHQGVIERT